MQTILRRPLTVLQVEDNPADVQLTSQAFEECGFPASIFHLASGWECIDFIKRQGRFERVQVSPDLVLLDLNLPGIHGRELLRFMREHPAYRQLPIIVMSTEASRPAVQECLRLANDFVVKLCAWDSFKREFGRAVGPYFAASA
jgi:two-component system response regulator